VTLAAERQHARPTDQRAPLAVTPAEAASLLGMSRNSFDRHVRDDLRLVRVGRMVRVPVCELERWIERNAARTLPEVVR
jgi:excisionase family DNA binding protein